MAERMKRLNFPVEHSLTMAIRRLALEREVSATKIYAEAIREYVARHCPATEPEKKGRKED